jgi:hypothetical protein
MPGEEATRLGGRADPVSKMLVYQPRRAVSEVVCGRAAAINSAAQPRQKLTPRGRTLQTPRHKVLRGAKDGIRVRQTYAALWLHLAGFWGWESEGLGVQSLSEGNPRGES